MSDTPRTDALHATDYHCRRRPRAYCRMTDHARELERELDACKKLMLECLADKNVRIAELQSEINCLRIAELQSEINCLRAALSNVEALKNLDC